MNKRKIIIFSVSFGNGHNQVSKVLLSHLRAKNFDVEIIDTFDAINKLFHKVVLDSYLQLIRYRPSVWGKLYQYSEDNPNSLLLKQFNAFLTNKLYRTLQEKQTAMIITTHPIATTLLANVIRKKKLTVKLYALLTDFAVHPMSIHEEVTGYFIASEHLRYYASMYKIDEGRFYPTGIPTTKAKVDQFSKTELRKKLHLDKGMKTVLVAGGGVGLAKFTKILTGLEQFEDKLQIICVTGENKRAKAKIERYQSKHQIRVLGFTNLFMEYLKASDVILSKAGGVTMSEALVCETPIIIFQPLPGQEEQNSQFLMNYGAAIKAEIVEEIPVLLERIIFNDHYHSLMTENATKLKQPEAASNIATIIYSDCFENRITQELIR
ncbi:glycosyltransferase [Anaerobacillus sp. CMMVII]|uniref:MGDG synthase family glycosyltransferase n=1 Tax=Anaerobacillus sp. CMMVII TaxID=2755588 RepID=UPI0021B79077|nr:glycosyltransferase [Anaerobacillus sp. CMMVII]MCT8140369.1 glycosyltransferase [Anaerobacillus sp. CMMVII]